MRVYRQLTFTDRLRIEKMLKEGISKRKQGRLAVNKACAAVRSKTDTKRKKPLFFTALLNYMA